MTTAPFLEYYGPLVLLPIISLLLTVHFSKRVVLSLFVATVVAALLYGGPHCLGVYYEVLIYSFSTDMMTWWLAIFPLWGILITLLEKAGWTMDFARWVSKFATTPRRAMLISQLLGMIVFIDDALSNVAVGTGMSPVTDSHLIPRTRLSFISIMTAGPMCILMPISSWAFACARAFTSVGININDSLIDTYTPCIKYMFFAYIMLIFVFAVCMQWIPPIGKFNREQERLAKEEHIVVPADCAVDGKAVHVDKLYAELREESKGAKFPWKFLATLAIITVVTILHGDIVMGAIVANLFIVIVMLIEKYSFWDICDWTMEGIKSMVGMVALFTMVVVLLTLNAGMGFDSYLVSLLTPLLNGKVLAAICFAVFTLYSSCGGGFAEMVILFTPVVVPIAFNVGANPYLCAAALVCASAAGSAMYVCGDVINMCAFASKLKPVPMARAIRPYALWISGLTTLAFLIAGLLGI